MKAELEKKNAIVVLVAAGFVAQLVWNCGLASFADEVTIEEEAQTTQTTTSTAQVPSPATVLGKDEISSLSQRLQAMKQQIDMGVQKQWLSVNDANTLRDRANQLAMQTDNLRISYSKDRAKEVERKANELNIAVSSAMKNAPSPASAGASYAQ